jgi:ribonuclease T1
MHAIARVFLRLLCAGLLWGLACLPATARVDASLSVVSLQDLPAEARTTITLIRQNGPFPYPRDGIEFRNRERLLPLRQRGYYREYTVRTPGERTRGARRIVAGAPEEFYYTADHYRSFQRVTP